MTGEDLARAALALEGAPFRLHGRDPATGLDCIGLFVVAMANAGRPVDLPNGYALRARSLPDLGSFAQAAGFVAVADSAPQPGDVCMVRPGPVQFHLVVAAGPTAFVHAHAGLGRVVVTPPDPAWSLASQWRLAPHS